MCDRPVLPRPGRNQHRLPVGRRHVKRELNAEAAHGVDDGVDVRVVLPRLELDDARLRYPQLRSQSPLAQIVIGALSLARRNESSGASSASSTCE